MTPKQLQKIAGSQARIARILGLSRAAVNKWFITNKIPRSRQYEIAARFPELKVSEGVQ
jgi:predicted transcriptional regulator